MSRLAISKIVSGGQTGVDRAALDVAIYLDIPHGGWCPAGRRAEDGPIPVGYQLRETDQRDYSVRTEKNVIESDGTLILYRNKLSGGTELTLRLARKHRRPRICFDLAGDSSSMTDQILAFASWLSANNIGVMNVAGPRESTAQGIGRQAEAFLVKALAGASVDDSGMF
jgi:hypothetical protein